MKFKNSLFTTVFLCCIAFASVAQFPYRCKVADIEELKKGEVVVAISDDQENNKIVEEIMASNWTTGKYKVIKSSELESYLKSNPKNFVITYLKNQSSRTYTGAAASAAKSADPNRNKALDKPTRTKTVLYKDVLLLLADVKNVKKIEQGNAMFKCFMDEELEFIDQTAEFTRQISVMNNLFTQPGLKDDQLGFLKMMRNYPTADPKKIITKELWIAESDAEKDEAKMNKAYPYKYKIVTKEAIAEAINSKKNDVVYLSYIAASETIDEGTIKIGASKARAASGLYLIQDAENNQILMLLSATTKVDHRYLGAIKSAASKAK